MNENEQDLIMRKKIEKREKVDTVLAFIMIAVLLACIVFVLYLKFIRKEDNTPNDNNETNDIITLSDIENELKNSTLVQDFNADGAVLDVVTSGSNINATYTKDDNSFVMEMTLVGNELAVVIDKNNEEIANSIYEEVSTIICTYYGNSRSDCTRTIASARTTPIDGIRFTTFDDIETIYIDITKKIDVNTITTYNQKTIVDLADTNYILSMNDTRLDHINISSDDTSIVASGNVYNLASEGSTLDIVFTVYNENGEELKTNKYSFTEDNLLTGSNTFTINIDLDQNISTSNIKKYSLEIVK